MKIDSPRFGCLEVETNKLIEFPRGLPGFEACKHFTLIELEGCTQSLAVLQSADDPEVAFALATPEHLGYRYEFVLSDEEEALLQAKEPADIVVMVILRRNEEDAPTATGKPAMKANLMAPLVFNVAAMRGMQKVITRPGVDGSVLAIA
jgi:flagellar assembly factor FliW